MNGFSGTRVLAVMIKEVKQLTRDRLTYAMMLGVPVLQLLLFGYAINSEPRHLPTAVLVQENSVFARSIVGALDHSAFFDLVAQARSPVELNEMIRDGRVQFAVTVPGDFTRRVSRGEKPQILVEADATDPSATSGAVAALAALPQEALAHDLKGAVAERGQSVPAFEVVVHRRYNPEAITAYNIVPGLLGVILTLTLVMMTALSVTRETERGTMESLLAMPIRPFEIMLGKIAPYVLVGFLQAALIVGAGILLFGVPVVGSMILLAALTTLFIATNLAFGYTFSTLAQNQLQAIQMAMMFFLPNLLLSGFLFPFAGMPNWAQWIGECLPLTHFVRIVRAIMLKGSTISDLNYDALALFGLMLFAMMVAVTRFRRTLD
jgi:ABC-2 type transport system permease protein